ncbi:hypothetical protein JCM15519_03990 [Fundidesulfovibrio butyratiphilus]
MRRRRGQGGQILKKEERQGGGNRPTDAMRSHRATAEAALPPARAFKRYQLPAQPAKKRQ